jgi:DNA-binding CsgD family transcriptional regulator
MTAAEKRIAEETCDEANIERIERPRRSLTSGGTITCPACGYEVSIGDTLTLREVEVLERVGLGEYNAQIAKVLRISQHTVANHVWSIFRKTGCQTRASVVVWGVANGYIVVPLNSASIARRKGAQP